MRWEYFGGFFLLEELEVYDGENSNGVDDEKGNKPSKLIVSCGSPKSKAFPNNIPQREDYDNDKKYRIFR